jgi:lycopene cyclase domain-containing protein
MSVDELGRWSYLVWLLAWSLPIVLGQWLAFGGLLARTFARWFPPSAALGAYFALADAVGIATGVWQIEARATVGVRLVGVLPLEEALFFVLTTLMVAQTTVLFLWRFGDLRGEPWRGWRAAFGWRRAA